MNRTRPTKRLSSSFIGVSRLLSSSGLPLPLPLRATVTSLSVDGRRGLRRRVHQPKPIRNFMLRCVLLTSSARYLPTGHSWSPAGARGSFLGLLWRVKFCKEGFGDVKRGFFGHTVEQFSDDEYECEFEGQKASSSVANIDEWKWKLSLLRRSEKDQEIVSRDKRDRRDFEQISNLAKRMGLYSELYVKVVVASKIPPSNYLPDLDDKRPQREVVIPLGLQRRVEGLLQEHLDRLKLHVGKDGQDSNVNENWDEGVTSEGNELSFVDASVMEKILQRSLRMRNVQRSWQESPLLPQLHDPKLDIYKEAKYLMLAIQELVAGDQCEGKFIFGRDTRKPGEPSDPNKFTKDGTTNQKILLQTLLMRAGHSRPNYKTKHLKTNEFRALVEFKGMQFVGKPKRNKQLAERSNETTSYML